MENHEAVSNGTQENRENKNMQKREREIRIVRGEEFKVQVRKQIDESDPFLDEYRKAARLLEGILTTAKKEKDNDGEPERKQDERKFGDVCYQNQDYNNNIIAFCGNRGDGKSSAMMTFIQEVIHPSDTLFKEESVVRKTNFTDTIYVDPSALDNVHNILDIVLAQMFGNFRDVYENGEKQCSAGVRIDKQNRQSREKLLRCFQEVYRSVSLIKDSAAILKEEYDDEGSISKLSKLSESVRLKENLRKLLEAYFAYMPFSSKHKGECCAIIIAIDDLDLSFAAAYKMAEEIRKYLILPGIVIVMAVRIAQLHFCVEEYNIKQLQQNFKNENNQQMRQEVQEMAERYVSKLIPLAHRVHLTRVQDFQNVKIVYTDKTNTESKEEKGTVVSGSVVEYVLQMIYEKTGMIFRPLVQGHSLILPDNMRGMVNLLVLLSNMTSPKNVTNDSEIRRKNIEALLNSYYREWIAVLPARDKAEKKLQQEIEKLTDLDSRMNLHIGVGALLRNLNETYDTNEQIKSTEAKEQEQLNDFPHQKTNQENNLHFVIHCLQYLMENHFKHEVYQYISAISFLYTLKLNQIASSGNENYELDVFTGRIIWGNIIDSLIPYVQGKNVPRTQFHLSSNSVIKCLEHYLGTSLGYSDATKKVSRKDNLNEDQKKKYVVGWLLFGLFCNPLDIKNNEVILFGKYIYNNSNLHKDQAVRIENYLIRLSMMGSLFEQINFGLLGIEKKYVLKIIDEIKEKNKNAISISKEIVSNIDVIMKFKEYCMEYRDYKEGATINENKKSARNKNLITTFLHNVSHYMEMSRRIEFKHAPNESFDNEEALCYLDCGLEKEVDIAELYSLFIEQIKSEKTNNLKNDIIYRSDVNVIDELYNIEESNKKKESNLSIEKQSENEAIKDE